MKSLTLFPVFLAALLSVTHAESTTGGALFNGKDLSGWRGDGYEVVDGAIVTTPTGKNLVTEQTFSNYVLDFDFKLPAGGNSGLGIHYPGVGDAAYTGMEIQILDLADPKHADLKDSQLHGSIYKLAAAKQGGLKPAGEWNHQRVTVIGDAVVVELNGESILRANLATLATQNPQHEGVKRRAGHLALLGHGSPVAFKNFKIVESPPPAYTEGVMAAGFTRLFDGKTLKGWKAGNSREWIADSRMIRHTGRIGDPADLWTEKEFGDFTLVFDWRWSGRGPMKKQPLVLADGNLKPGPDGKPDLVEIEELDSGIYLRGQSTSQVNLWNWTVGSGEVYGYRTNPDMPAEVRAQVTPKMKADRPIGEWNRTMITMKGDRLTVSLNGRAVIENAQLPGVSARGPIGLQSHGAAIDFANLWIKEY
jgi:Domain of Unknown Function (DUF1080)